MVASFLFGLAFGPELARLLARMRARMDIQMGTRPSAVASRAPASSGRSRASLGAPRARHRRRWRSCSARVRTRVHRVHVRAHAASLSPELSYLTSAQNSDGGFGGAQGQTRSELYTAWAAIGLAAAGRDPASVRRDGHSVLDALRAEASTLSGLGDAERTILAAARVRRLVVLVRRARPRRRSAERARQRRLLRALVNLTAFAIFALRAVGHSPSYPAIRDAAGWIERQQNSDGGFGFGERGSPSDVDDTGAALQALADAGAHNARVLGAAADYLIRSQNLDGGFPQQTAANPTPSRPPGRSRA